MELQNLIRFTFLACTIGLLAACDSADSSNPAPTTTTISGSIFAAPVSDATVTIEDTNGNTIADPVSTGDDGTFTVTLDNTDLASTLVFESTGGDFTDEATGNPNVDPAGSMSAMVEANTLSATSNSVHATPGTTIVRKLVPGMTLADAQNAFNSAFGYTPDSSIAPMDTTNPAAGTDDEEILAGLRAAAFSQLAMELGLAPDQQFDLFDALAEDLSSDGLLDGAGATSLVLPEDIQNRFATALLNYHNNGLTMPTIDEFNPNNKTVLTSDKIGILPFGKVTYTKDYRVQYMGMMSYVGKTTFTLKITLPDGTTPVNNLAPKLVPIMNMATMRHDTPLGDVTNNNDGTYEFEIYYLMPNMMGGYWDLGVDLDGTTDNTAHFYPTVMMPTDGTPSVVLRGLAGDDVIPTMEGDQPRPYILFKESITNSASAGKHDFSVFVVARETMMKHPPVDVGLVMNAGTTYELAVTSVTVEMLVLQGSNWTPVTVTNDGSGYFTATDISGLTASVNPDTGLAPIRVKLSVNGAQKTLKGDTPVTDVNDYQTFNVMLP